MNALTLIVLINLIKEVLKELLGMILVDEIKRYFLILTFRFSTPHLLKSVINKLKVNLLTSVMSGLIWQIGSVNGSTALSSANKGVPLKPSGFLSLADNISFNPDVLAVGAGAKAAFPFRTDSLQKAHWISDTAKKFKFYYYGNKMSRKYVFGT